MIVQSALGNNVIVGAKPHMIVQSALGNNVIVGQKTTI
jgi:acetyltransferase-like isoleucine patch superfamily enzyme